MFEFGKKGGTESGQQTAARDIRHGEGGQSPVSSSTQSENTAPPAAPRAASTGTRREAAIGPSIRINGDLRGEEDLSVEGEVEGTVHLASNTLTIGSQGRVRANVYAHSIYVEGVMEGDLYGSEQVIVRKTAQVRGNITSPRVTLEDGATFKGSIEMDAEAVKSALAKTTGRSAAASAANGSHESTNVMNKPKTGTPGSSGEAQRSSAAR